ncbi:MAG: ComF family protein [Thermoanaerobaculia bacterium]
MSGNILSSLGRSAARIVLPSWCVVCARELPWRNRVASCCGPCWEDLPQIRTKQCRSCAMAWSGETSGDLCIDCQLDPLPVGWTVAWGHYRGGLERLLHAFKFERHDFLEDSLATLLLDAIDTRSDREFDVVVPVPMHRSKERRRGYNQAELLARAVARRLAVRCEPPLLTKTFERETQSTLARNERAANVRGAFRASPRVEGSSILMVDDICTTGETFRACATELLRAGAKRVCAVAVAKA